MLLIGPAIVFFGFSSLLVHLCRSGSVWRFPAFSASVLVTVLYLPMWAWVTLHPPGRGVLPWLQPIVLLTQLGAWCEAFALVTRKLPPRERQWMLTTLIITALICVVRMWGLQSVPYHAIRSYAYVAMAIGGVVTAGWMWINPDRIAAEFRSHGLILTCYFCGHALSGLAKTAGFRWWIASMIYCAVSAGCVTMWSLRLKSQARLENELHIRDSAITRPLTFIH